MRIITQDEVNEGIRLHGLWLAGKEGGKRANFQDADLHGANLERANLERANLWGVNLQGCNLVVHTSHGAA